jgi:hypothetical protein
MYTAEQINPNITCPTRVFCAAHLVHLTQDAATHCWNINGLMRDADRYLNCFGPSTASLIAEQAEIIKLMSKTMVRMLGSLQTPRKFEQFNFLIVPQWHRFAWALHPTLAKLCVLFVVLMKAIWQGNKNCLLLPLQLPSCPPKSPISCCRLLLLNKMVGPCPER